MDGLANYFVKSKWGTNAIYLYLSANTAGVKYAAELGFATSGAKRAHNPK